MKSQTSSNEDTQSEQENTDRCRWGSGRVAVTALWPTIAAALNEGLSMQMIYDKHQAQLGQTYKNFAKLVATRKRKERNGKTEAQHPERDRPHPVHERQRTTAERPGAPTRFTHSATGNKDDLI